MISRLQSIIIAFNKTLDRQGAENSKTKLEPHVHDRHQNLTWRLTALMGSASGNPSIIDQLRCNQLNGPGLKSSRKISGHGCNNCYGHITPDRGNRVGLFFDKPLRPSCEPSTSALLGTVGIKSLSQFSLVEGSPCLQVFSRFEPMMCGYRLTRVRIPVVAAGHC